MKHIVTGIVAPVDAGKTTLTEALMYAAGKLRRQGRVDSGDSFLDFNELERRRGITIFPHQAELFWKDMKLTLLDTPGHIDFSAQTEQVLSVLDCAILVISARDGVTGQVRTLWNMLEHYNVPVFVFINKTDLATTARAALKELDDGIVFFDGTQEEELAALDEKLLEKYLEEGTLAPEDICALIKARTAFPCLSGSALKLDGINALLDGILHLAPELPQKDDLSARIFRISHDDKGARLTWLRLTGGALKTKDRLPDGQQVNGLRVYDGKRYSDVSEVSCGDVCAIPNLQGTSAGMGLGRTESLNAPLVTPVLSYAACPADGSLDACRKALKLLEDEDRSLNVSWSNRTGELRVQLMGQIQLETLQQVMLGRFGIEVTFEKGKTLYKETITEPVEGVGHFEPLRHYSEVHLLMEPGEPGTGLVIGSDCSLEVLDRNWQSQIVSCLKDKEHLGVLTGAPLTDVRITLISGRASIKHTVGGDFREASARAVRQGLMMLKEKGCVRLLEPWYSFTLRVPESQLGRAMNDIQLMSGTFTLDQSAGTLTGLAPVSEMQNYAASVRSYTHGEGSLETVVSGYRPCHNEAEVIAACSYDPVSDMDNTPQSVFCAHGAGFTVDWQNVPEMAHVPYRLS